MTNTDQPSSKRKRTTIKLRKADKDAIETIRRRYGLSTDSDAIRLSARIVARAVALDGAALPLDTLPSDGELLLPLPIFLDDDDRVALSAIKERFGVKNGNSAMRLAVQVLVRVERFALSPFPMTR